MESLAEIAVNKCLQIRSDDTVTIEFNEHFTRLAEDIAVECFKKGADVLLNLYTDRYYLGYMTHLSEESLRQPSVWCRELSRNSTAIVWLGGIYDPSILRKIPPEKIAANRAGEASAHYPMMKERKVKSLGLAIAQVTRPRAKAYGINFNAWERMMNAASRVDPEPLTNKAKELAEQLQNAETVHVTSPNGTDLTFSTKGRRPLINDGIIDETDMMEENFEASIPAGAVQVAVLENSANGRAVFDVPTPIPGRTVKRLLWTFRNGQLTSFEGDKSAEYLRKQWEASSGDKDRIGGLMIGLNPKAKLGYTVNELVEGAVSILVGGNEEWGGTNKPGFWHFGTVSKATLELDRTTIVQNGIIT